MDQALFVKDLLLHGVHRLKIGKGVRELFDSEVEHALGLEAAGESEQHLGADVRVARGLLEVGNGGAEIAEVVECGSEFEAELRVGRVLVDAALALLNLLGEAVGAAGLERGLEFFVVRICRDGGFEGLQIGLNGAVVHLGGLCGEGDVSGAE